METNEQHGEQTRQSSAGQTECPPAGTSGGGPGVPTNGGGQCDCPPWPTDPLPEEGSIRRLLDALAELLRSQEDNPTDATNQLDKDVADCEKEYQGIGDSVKAYGIREIYRKAGFQCECFGC